MLKWLQGGGARERQPRRVAVIDTAQLDRSRSVVLIRRDNLEHLLLIGGPANMVIQSKIVRTGAHVPAGLFGPARLDLPRNFQPAHAVGSSAAAQREIARQRAELAP